MDLNNLVLLFLLVVTGLFFYKYFSLITNKYKPKLLIDDELKNVFNRDWVTYPHPTVLRRPVIFLLDYF